jgi:hypothetical protein
MEAGWRWGGTTQFRLRRGQCRWYTTGACMVQQPAVNSARHHVGRDTTRGGQQMMQGRGGRRRLSQEGVLTYKNNTMITACPPMVSVPLT